MYEYGARCAAGSGCGSEADLPAATITATSRLQATAIIRVASTPTYLTSTKPVSSAPANAPSVFR